MMLTLDKTQSAKLQDAYGDKNMDLGQGESSRMLAAFCSKSKRPLFRPQ